MLSRILPLLLASVALVVVVGQTALAHEATHEGKVVKVESGKLTMTRNADKKQQQHTMTVAASATITLDGKTAKLDDLKEGFHVKVTNDDKHVVTKIEAHSKQQ